MDADAAAGSPGKAASGEVEQAPAPGGPPPAAAAPDSDELTSEPVGQRPASRASDRPASRASDVSASASEADLAAAGRPGPPLPPLAELEASPFVDLQHPIGWYEGAKLVLMAPVVVFKASAASFWWAWRRSACWLGSACLAVQPCALPIPRSQLLLLAVAVCYAWAILVLLLLGHTPHTPMRPFRHGRLGRGHAHHAVCMLACAGRCPTPDGRRVRLPPPRRQFLVRQWIHQWGRFLLFVSGFYVIPVRGRRNLAAAEACRCGLAGRLLSPRTRLPLPGATADAAAARTFWLTLRVHALLPCCRALLVFNHPSYVDAAVIATMFTPSGWQRSSCYCSSCGRQRAARVSLAAPPCPPRRPALVAPPLQASARRAWRPSPSSAASAWRCRRALPRGRAPRRSRLPCILLRPAQRRAEPRECLHWRRHPAAQPPANLAAAAVLHRAARGGGPLQQPRAQGRPCQGHRRARGRAQARLCLRGCLCCDARRPRLALGWRASPGAGRSHSRALLLRVPAPRIKRIGHRGGGPTRCWP